MSVENSSFLESYLPYLLRQADQMLSAPFYRVLADYDVGRSEWRVLAVLEDLGQMTVLELAAAALSPQPTVTHAVRRLEKRGLVTRSTDADDKRRRMIAITGSGTELTRTLIAQASNLEADVLSEVGDMSELATMLGQLTSRVEQSRANAEIDTKAG